MFDWSMIGGLEVPAVTIEGENSFNKRKKKQVFLNNNQQ
jgi:hypothetical protein